MVVHKVPDGKLPAELPAGIKLAINLKRANTLGLTLRVRLDGLELAYRTDPGA